MTQKPEVKECSDEVANPRKALNSTKDPLSEDVYGINTEDETSS